MFSFSQWLQSCAACCIISENSCFLYFVQFSHCLHGKDKSKPYLFLKAENISLFPPRLTFAIHPLHCSQSDSLKTNLIILAPNCNDGCWLYMVSSLPTPTAPFFTIPQIPLYAPALLNYFQCSSNTLCSLSHPDHCKYSSLDLGYLPCTSHIHYPWLISSCLL